MKIRLVAMDVDGTMTDGKIYIGPTGEMMKAFNVKDGYGIKMLKDRGIVTAIITARISLIVEQRAKELGIDEVCQGIQKKDEALKKLCEKYSIDPEETVFIGDDIGDIPALLYAGISICPHDAVTEVKDIARLVTSSRGGEGAIRNAADWILQNTEFNQA